MYWTKTLSNLFVIGIVVMAGTILGILNIALAVNIECPNASEQGNYVLCTENDSSGLNPGKQAKNIMDGDNYVTAKPVYCTSNIDLAIVDTSVGGDYADLVCETRSHN